MFGLKIYTVHVKPDVTNAAETPVFVREGGFNPWAFLLMFIWTLYKRLWLPAVCILAFQITIVVLTRHHFLSPLSAAIIQFAFQIWVGFQANDWLRMKLRARGFIIADIVSGDSLLRAEQRYFERYLAAAS